MTRPSLRVLIVEDPADAEVLLREIQRGGYEVTYDQVQSAVALRAAIEGAAWDLVISGDRIPGFTAQNALALVKATNPDLPVILILETVAEDAVAAAIQAGAADILLHGRLARVLATVARVRQDAIARADRRRATEALSRSEAQYRSLVDHAVCGLCQAAADGRILAANPALVTMLGFASAEALAATPLPDLFVEDSGRLALMQRVKERQRFLGIETSWRRKAGEAIRVRLSGVVLQEADHGVPVFELVVEDITEGQRRQDEQRQAQVMEAVGQLAGGVAHDFNDLLTAILGFGGLLTAEIGPEAPGGADLREIVAAAERASVLTRQLQVFSSKPAAAVTPLNLNDAIRALHPSLVQLLGEPVKLQVQLDRALGAVMADPPRLEQVLVNLAVNARHAMPNGGTLTIETRNSVRESEFRSMNLGPNPDTFAMLRVTDTGAGMPSKITGRVLEPFFAIKERGKGSGLGLAAVHGIVKQLGGGIFVDSEPGRGTTFRVYLPKTDRAARAPEARPAVVSTLAGSETILVVEDEAGVRAFARAALSRQGYTVLEAPTAQGALALLADRTRPIHLVLADVVLPGTSGRELAAQVSREFPWTRLLLMSGHADRQDTSERGGEPAGPPVLEKPFNAATLLARVRTALTAQVTVPR